MTERAYDDGDGRWDIQVMCDSCGIGRWDVEPKDGWLRRWGPDEDEDYCPKCWDTEEDLT